MSGKWTKIIMLTALLGGLCASIQANTSSAGNSMLDLNADGHRPLVRVALLLPLRSSVLGAAADAVRRGFLAAAEQKRSNIVVTIIQTGDASAEVLGVYHDASAKYDIIVGPLSRSAVTALAQSSAVSKPTIALTQPDLPDIPDRRLPSRMIMMGLSVEEEARQVATWVEREKPPGKIFAVSTNMTWQRRAVKAFVQQARKIGMTVDNLEFSGSSHTLGASDLMQLNRRIQAEKPALLFVALDATQTIQLRKVIGGDVPLYGTSQLNPLAMTTAAGAPPVNRLPELNGVYLLDLPWQLQANHPTVMAYPRAIAKTGSPPNADLERLYGLGIDAFRVADEIARQRSDFDIHGVTGQLYVNMAVGAAHFQRKLIQAVYQDGVTIPVSDQR